MQVLTIAVAVALVGAATAHPERKRTTTKHKSKHVKADEAYDIYLGLGGDRQLKKEDKEGHTEMMSVSTTAPTELDGASYCTWSPEYTCYVTGWPACCEADPSACPEERPGCEITTSTTTAATSATTTAATATTTDMSLPLLGTDYCTYGPDDECYVMGKPACCFDDAVECPEEAPACDVTTTVAPPTDQEEPTFVEEVAPDDGSAVLGVATAACAVAGAALLLSL